MNGELAEQHFAQRKEWFRKFRDSKPILNGHQNADYPRYCDLCATIIAGNETIAPVEHHAAGEMDVCHSCLAVWTRVLDASESDRVDLLETFARAEKETVQQICDVERNKKCCVCEILPAKFVPNASHIGRDWRGDFCGACNHSCLFLKAPQAKDPCCLMIAVVCTDLPAKTLWNMTEEEANVLAQNVDGRANDDDNDDDANDD